MSERPALLVVLGLVVGLVVGAVVGAAVAGPRASLSVPSQSTSTATGCADGDASAWVGQVPVLDATVVEFQNYSVAHEGAALDVRTTLSQRAPGDWVLAYETTPGEDAGKSVPEDCSPRTLVSSSVALPRSFATLTVTLDGEVVTVVSSADAARFRSLDAANASRPARARPGGL